jgi:hypothetical protein
MPTKFCPHCDNILDISKTPPKVKITQVKNDDIDATPTTVSDTNTDSSDSESSDDDMRELEEQNKLVESIIEKITAGEDITESMLNNIKIDQITKNKLYVKLDKKTKAKVQEKLNLHIEKLDDATSAYYTCKNCLYSETIHPETLIISRASGVESNTYINLDKLMNRIHSKILPVTRDYICINDKCATNEKNETKEAVFFRLVGSLQVWYACKVCKSYWKGS